LNLFILIPFVSNGFPMPPRRQDDPLIERRQEAVGRYLVMGYTQLEIAEALEKEKITNPETGQPYDRTTIGKDIAAVNRKWKTSTKASIEQHRARQLAELSELKRVGWKKDNPALVLNALTHESRLTDTSAPIRINIDLVSSLWDALEKRGRDPEQVLKAMLKKLTDSS
jgi:hypothetical protein